MPGALKLYIAGLVTFAAAAVVVTSLAVSVSPEIGLGGTGTLNLILGVGFWTLITLIASALPIVLPGGSMVAVSMAPVIVAMNLGGPAAVAWGRRSPRKLARSSAGGADEATGLEQYRPGSAGLLGARD